jgi:hypothetical protein
MSTPLFSINGAAEVLERDRRTITKALRYVKPDKKERGQSRWRLRTILDALNELPGSNSSRRRNDNTTYDDWNPDWKNQDPRVVWRDKRILASIAEFEKAFAEMEAIEDMEQRREFAVAKLAPLLLFHDRHFTQWLIESGGDDDTAYRKVSELWLLELVGVRSVCNWTEHEAHEFLVNPFEYD